MFKTMDITMEILGGSEESLQLPEPVSICKMTDMFLCQKLGHLWPLKVGGIVLGRVCMGKNALFYYMLLSKAPPSNGEKGFTVSERCHGKQRPVLSLGRSFPFKSELL